MGSKFRFHILIGSLFWLVCSIASQQPYVGETTTDCPNPHLSNGTSGYLCNTANRSCKSFLTFRSRSPFNSVSSISTLLGSDPSDLSRVNSVALPHTFPSEQLVLVPINCSCSGRFLQANVSFTTRLGDTYLAIANETLQGLSTCQSLISQNPNVSATNILGGERILVPLRCACLTLTQTDLGFNYLLSYLVLFGDTVSQITQRFESFGADYGTVLAANQLREESIINPFTTLLIPLKSEPSSTGIKEPASLPPPPPPSPSTPPSPDSTRTWVYILVAVVGVVVLAAAIGAVVFCLCVRRRKKKAMLSTAEIDKFDSYEKPLEQKLGGESSSITLESISSVAQSVKVYSFEELQAATHNFSPAHLIKGSVYRATINGDSAAIKKMNGDVSKQINLLNKTNHSNLIRLSGVCSYEGHWYLVFEYAAKGPLNDWIDSSNNSSNGKFLSWTQRIQIAVDVATGLNYLHSFMIPPHVHKDLKMENVLLDSDFRGKISNFSLARSAGYEEGEFTLTMHIVGTRGYMAPEYLENGLVSTNLDVYSFGILMIEMFTGNEVSELVRNENLQVSDVLKRVLNETNGKEYLSHLMDPSLEGNFPIDLVVFAMSIIDRCLNKDPSQRPSMDEIAQSLGRILNSSLSWELSNT